MNAQSGKSRELGSHKPEFLWRPTRDELVTTKFMRNRLLFTLLAREILPRLRQEKNRPLRLLFWACSTGAEPFTLKLLLGADSPDEITAIDCDAGAIQQAQQAIYQPDAWTMFFDGAQSLLTGAELNELFEPASPPPACRIKDKYRRKVAFQTGDLFAASPAVPENHFDLVVCNNLLLHLKDHSASAAFDYLLRYINETGLLLVAGCNPNVRAAAAKRLNLLPLPEKLAEISRNWAGVSGAWHFPQRPAWAYPEPEESDPDFPFLAGELFGRGPGRQTETTRLSGHAPAQPKNIIITGSTFWNPGDDFVREGVIRVLQNVFSEETLNFLFYNFNPDVLPHISRLPQSNVITQGDLEAFRDHVDAIIVVGVSAGHELKPVYRWILANQLASKVYLISGHYESAYAAEHIGQEPEASIFKQARIIIGRTNKCPDFIRENKIPYHRVKCPALLSVREVKQIPAGRKIERVGFSIQLPKSRGGLVNQDCAEGSYQLALESLMDLSESYQVELVAHHKTEYFHFLENLRGTGIPVVFSSFYQDLFTTYRRYDLVVTTRLHTSLFANGHGLPGIIINDSERHTHALEGFPHSVMVNTRKDFDAALARWQASDLAAIAREAAQFKTDLLAQYISLIKPAAKPVPAGTTDCAAIRQLKDTLLPALEAGENKDRVLRIVSGLEKDYWIEHHDLIRYRETKPWFDTATFLNWYAESLSPARYLEIGVRRGRSMAQVLVQSPLTEAFGFDLWIPGYASEPENGIIAANPGPEFVQRELKKLGVQRLPTLIQGDSHETVPAFFANPANPQIFDLILVDGDHTAAGARADLEIAFAHLAPGGALVFDDICHPAHLDLLDVWNEFVDQHPNHLFITDQSGQGTAVTFRPPFDRLRLALKMEGGQWGQPAAPPACSPDLFPAKNANPGSKLEAAQRILWIRTDSIGDAVLASAMLEPIRQKYPRAKISVLCQQHVADLFTACPFLNFIICYDRKLVESHPDERQKILAEIATFNPDVVLNSVRSRDKLSDEFALAAAGAYRIAIEGDLNNITPADRNAARAAYDFLIPAPTAHQNELQCHAAFLRGIGIDAGDLQPATWTTPDEELLADEFFKLQGLDPQKTIALFPGAQHEVRVYHGYAQGLKSLADFRFLIFGDETQVKLAEDIGRQFPRRTVNLCGRSSLRETVALVKRCRLYVGAESAGAHIACAVGVANVVLLGGGHFGRFIPYSPLTSAAVLPLDCFDCNWRCKHHRAHCIKDVSPNLLAEAIHHTLKATSRCPRVFLQSHQSWRTRAGLPSWRRPDALLTGHEVEFIEINCGTPAADSLPALSSLFERVACPACGSLMAAAARKSADIVQCLDCDTVYLRTRHTVEAMRRLYQSYANEGSHMALPKTPVEAERSGLKRDYFLEEILQFIKPGGDFLDIGCGWGAFLLNARSKGFSPRGIELTKSCVNYANTQLQIPVTDTQLTESEIPAASLQVVTMNHVLEHLPDLRGALKKVVESLTPGGMFCGIVPNFASACSQMLGEKWYWLDPNYHYQHFTPATLRKTLESAGLAVERIYTATGDYGVEEVRKVFVQTDAKFGDAEYFQAALKKHEADGRGEEIRFFARKPITVKLPGSSPPPADECVLIPPQPQEFEPVVTVVVSTYASEKLMAACLTNLSRQTIFDQIEVIVVDSGSPENERSVVGEFQRKFSNIRYLRTPRETLYAAWNRALKLARGRYFANVNTDDGLRDDALEILTAALDKNADCAYGYADCGWTTKPNDTFPTAHIIKTVKYPDYAPVETLFYCITGCLQFFRADILRQLGGYDATLKCAGDYEATLKVMAARLHCVHVPEVLSLFYQNASGLTQASNRAALEHDHVMDRYRANLNLANIFKVDATDRAAVSLAATALASRCERFFVPWEDKPLEHLDYAISCYQQALDLDPKNELAAFGLCALYQRLQRLQKLRPELLQRWPNLQPVIDRALIGEVAAAPHVPHALLGPVYRPAQHHGQPTAAALAAEPRALQPWIARIDGRHVYLSEDLFPRASGLRFQPQELQAGAKRLAGLLSELPPFYAHFGGAGDALLLLASFYDKRPASVVFCHPNGIGAARSLFDAFPKLSKIYFLPQHAEPFFHLFLRHFVCELKSCLGAGTTPRSAYDEEWKAGLDIFKKYHIGQAPRWAAAWRRNAGSKRVALAPQGSLSGMVGSKRNVIRPDLWPQVIAHIVERGFEPVILGVPAEAKEYPSLPGCIEARHESFPAQMKIIGQCAGLVGADSWAKTFSALAEIPTLVFEPIKGADLGPWKDPSDWVFIEPWPSIKLIRSLEEFRQSFDGRIAGIPGAEPAGNLRPIIAWEGSFLDYGSLSHINREVTARLATTLDLHAVSPNGLNNRAKSDPEIQRFARKLAAKAPAGAAVTVRHQWPPDWSRPEHGALVVIQPWEFGVLPKAWVEQAANVDEFWVPSPLVRRMYLASGIAPEKVRVVPNGVDTGKFRPGIKPLALPTRKKFKFLFVGGTIARKGPDLLLEVYSKTFSAEDDVCLVIKDFGGDSFYQGQTAEAAIRSLQQKPQAPEILYLKDELASEQMPSLYAACDCLVLPYRGEGFGMPVLEAMACGRPVIVTAGGATESFVTAEAGWKIPSHGILVGDRVGGLQLVKSGWLLEPSKPHLAALLKIAVSHPDECRKRGAAGRAIAEKKFDWSDICAAIAHRLKELGANATESVKTDTVQPESGGDATGAAPKNLAPPPVAQIGRLDEARELFARKDLPAAWKSGLAAMALRPCHPEACLLLAEIALAAGDAKTAKRCAQRARVHAPGWSAARQFLSRPLKGGNHTSGFELPAAFATSESSILNRLSVCLIVKNEEKLLAQCLQSVRGIAFQIIVVDTGSTDRTVEIAREYGSEIVTFTWGDDFSAARNCALAKATGDWVLMLDADEELPLDQRARLMADIAQGKAIGYRLPLVNVEHEANGHSFVPRLFRNIPGSFYTGRIHEQIFPSLMPPAKAWGLELRLGTAQLLHHGYTKQLMQDRDKIRRNLELLRLAVAEDPTDANLVMNFGLELVRSGDLSAGVEKYREAFQLMTAGREDETAPELREVLLTQFTSQLYKLRAHEEVVQVLNSPLARKAGLTASLHFALGLALFELKQFAPAAEQMRLCVNRRHLPALAPINTDILSAAPEHCRALCLAQSGDAAGAEKSFLAALAEKPPLAGTGAGVKLDYARFLAAQNRAVEAFHKLHELVAADSRHLAAWQTGAEIALSQPDFLEFAGNWTAEAMRYVGEDFTVNRQRAETLMLTGDTAAARPMWERLWQSERQPTILAALILCETAESQTGHAPDRMVDEPATSRAFIKWYQRLIAMRAYPVVQRLNERLESLSGTLPTASAMLQKALTEPLQPAR